MALPRHPRNQQSPRTGLRSSQCISDVTTGPAGSCREQPCHQSRFPSVWMCRSAKPPVTGFPPFHKLPEVAKVPARAAEKRGSALDLLWCCGCFMANNLWLFLAATFSFAPQWSAVVYSCWNLNKFDIFLQLLLLWWAIYPRVFSPSLFLFQLFAHISWNDFIRSASSS